MNLFVHFGRLSRVGCIIGFSALSFTACATGPQTTAAATGAVVETPTPTQAAANTETVGGAGAPAQEAQNAAGEIVVYAADLPESTLYELERWEDAAAASGILLGVTNNGDELDAPPEDDPHATFPVQAQAGIPYRCWIHMKVGTPKGKSTANVIWVQFSNAVDENGQEILTPESDSFLTAQGPAQEGWTWVECALEGSASDASLVSFNTSGEVTVRLQAGMEGVGFDQLVLSAAQYLKESPAVAIVQR